jgi:hypothetical protein
MEMKTRSLRLSGQRHWWADKPFSEEAWIALLYSPDWAEKAYKRIGRSRTRELRRTLAICLLSGLKRGLQQAKSFKKKLSS